MERITLTVPEIAAALGVSRMSAYAAVRAGVIPSIRIGRRVLVPRAALERLLDGAGSTVTQGTAEPQQQLKDATRASKARQDPSPPLGSTSEADVP